MASSPIVARWELSRRLAALRKDRGLDVKAITDHLGFTRNYWSAVENDRTLIAADKLELLLNLFEVDDIERDELTQLREDGRKRGWWDDYPDISETAKRLFGLEAGATQIRTYEPQLVPGLLQTETYTRAVIGSDPITSPAKVEELVQVRQRRQRVLVENPPSLVALLGEGVLLQEVAGQVAQVEQLLHLADYAEDHRTNIELRLLPFKDTPAAIAGSSTLVFIEFGLNPHLPTIAWQEALRTLDIVEGLDEEFRRLELAWQEGLRRSLSHDDSILRIRDLAST